MDGDFQGYYGGIRGLQEQDRTGQDRTKGTLWRLQRDWIWTGLNWTWTLWNWMDWSGLEWNSKGLLSGMDGERDRIPSGWTTGQSWLAGQDRTGLLVCFARIFFWFFVTLSLSTTRHFTQSTTTFDSRLESLTHSTLYDLAPSGVGDAYPLSSMTAHMYRHHPRRPSGSEYLLTCS